MPPNRIEITHRGIISAPPDPIENSRIRKIARFAGITIKRNRITALKRSPFSPQETFLPINCNRIFLVSSIFLPFRFVVHSKKRINFLDRNFFENSSNRLAQPMAPISSDSKICRNVGTDRFKNRVDCAIGRNRRTARKLRTKREGKKKKNGALSPRGHCYYHYETRWRHSWRLKTLIA